MNKILLKTLLLSWIAILASSRIGYCTHLRAADVVVERICGTNTYRIKIIAYLNSTSSTPFGAASFLSFGDGSPDHDIPQIIATPRPDLGPDISIAEYETSHEYPEGEFTITYIEHDRSSSIINIVNAFDVAYVTSITINTSAKFGCNRYPRLTVIPLDRGCPGVAFSHSPGAVDDDGDSLSYHFSTPMNNINTFIPDELYTLPTDRVFYTDYETGNETNDGQPFIKIDTTGTLTWNAPEMIGEYCVAFNIVEWRKNEEGTYEKVSVTVRDMQILIEECANVRPDLIIPADLCVIAGTKVVGTFIGSDPEGHPVKIELFSLAFDFPADQSPATVTPDPPTFVTSQPPATVLFEWNTNASHVRQQAYQVVAKITDQPPEGPGLVTFATWTIRVLAPAPEFENVSLDVVKKHGVLEWKSYTSSPKKLQVWRKVGQFPFNRPCYQGLPASSGYSLVQELSTDETEYTDTNNGMGLAPAATYCYRLIALVNDAKSIVSEEYCIGPVQRDAPVITHVTVENTSNVGSIRVSWLSPIDINKDQFPEPYQYHVYRAVGFYGDEGIIKVISTEDTTSLDSNVNSEDSVYNYRIVVYSKPAFSEDFIPVDTSAVASSVRLNAVAGIGQIKLQWRDSVAWSNVAAERPYHHIYRAMGLANDQDLELIDSVQVIDSGFVYTDNGRFDNRPLENNSIYTYKVMTIGTYGSPGIPLLKNFSQKISIYPENDLLACAPSLSVDMLDCETYLRSNTCDKNIFDNSISWEPFFTDTCRIDVVAYRIYRAEDVGNAYTPIAEVDTNGYVDRNLPSPMMCYRVSAIDSRGQEGPLSEPICNDTCPNFELPNVFTPNNDGCNDLFTSRYAQTATPCVTTKEYNCPRFVRSVHVKIYNRWGKQVYARESDDKDGIYIDWDGKDSTGKEMATGVYFYVAEIEFAVFDKSKEKLVIKDWLHLVR